MRKLLANIGARDLCVFGGMALLTAGAGMIYLPAAPICAGLLLLYLGLHGVPAWR